MKRLIVSLVLALTLAATPVSAMPKQVETTTHRIEMHNTEGGDICSSTAIGPHALLTATHCDLGSPMVTVDGKDAAIVERLADSNDHTIYIVNLTFKKYAEFAEQNAKLGDEVWLRGNPDGIPQLVRHGVYSGRVKQTDATTKAVLVVDIWDINGWHGDSGAAIFNNHGQMLAVVSIVISDEGWVMLGTFPLHFTSAQIETAAKK